MFSNKTKPKDFSRKSIEAEAVAAKYQHPKILLIDTVPEIEKTLVKEGYNVTIGTFGTPYRVKKSSSYQPVVMKPSLPNYSEQEIVVIDLVPEDPKDGPLGEKMLPESELDWWAKCSSGIIDPRPRAMAMVQEKFDRILKNGGVFIVFSDSRDNQEFVHAIDYGGYSKLSIRKELHYDNWSFLSLLYNLSITFDHGEEIAAVKPELALVRLLDDHLDGATFCCTFEAEGQLEKRWVPLAMNKFGATVAGMICPTEQTKGWILILPRIKKKDRLLSALLKNILPDLSPALFPHAEGQKWIHRTEYELPSVVEKAKQISEIQAETARQVSDLEKAIEGDRNKNAYLYALIRETGDPLVEAVEKAFALLGFKSVVDVDEEMTKAGKESSLREDLRIHDNSPILVVDIKGVGGHPSDAEALQAQKHAFIYIQEQNRADVRGLTIINHQRLLPPLERDNDMPFRKEILANAEQVKLGLMTGWDLFRLVRGFIQNKWKPEQVIPLFYQTGRILPLPRHYEYFGKVKQVWKTAYSVEIEKGKIHVGERISIELPVDFSEQQLTSMKLNNSNVEEAAAKCEVGIQRDESSPKLKSGMLVYRIID